MRPKHKNRTLGKASNSKKQPKKMSTSIDKGPSQRSPKLTKYSQRNLKNFFSQPSTEIVVSKEVKNIPLIYAYKPNQLKRTLVEDPNKYSIFFHKHETNCLLNDQFLKAFLANFKQWRKKLRAQLFQLVDDVINSQKFMDKNFEQNVSFRLLQIKKFNDICKVSLEKILQNKKTAEVRKVYQSFLSTELYVIKISQLIEMLYRYFNKCLKYLQNIDNVKILKQNISQDKQFFQNQIFELVTVCATHPQSIIMNRIEFKIKNKFSMISKYIMRLLELISKAKVHLQNLEGTYERLKNRKKQYLLISDLQALINLIIEDNMKQEDQQAMRATPEIWKNIKIKIDQAKYQIIQQLCPLTIKTIQISIEKLDKTNVLMLVKSRGKQFQQLKKKILLLIKIFKGYLPNIHEATSRTYAQKLINTQDVKAFNSKKHQIVNQLLQKLNLCIKVSAQKFNAITEHAHLLQGLVEYVQTFDSTISFNSSFHTYLQKLQETIKDYQIKKFQLIKQLLKTVPTFDYNPSNKNQAEIFHRLAQIIQFSNVKAQELILKVDRPQSAPKSKSRRNTMKHHFKQLSKKYQQLINNVLPNVMDQVCKLQQYLELQILLVFLNGDRLTTQFIWGYRNIDKINKSKNKVFDEANKTKECQKVDNLLNKLATLCQQEQISAQKLKNGHIVSHFICQLMEMYLFSLCDIQRAHEIMQSQFNAYSESKIKQNHSLSIRVNTEANDSIHHTIRRLKIISQLLKNRRKHIGEQKNFEIYINEQIRYIEKFIQIQMQFELYEKSQNNNNLYPSIGFISNWSATTFNLTVKSHKPQQFNNYLSYIKKVLKHQEFNLQAKIDKYQNINDQESIVRLKAAMNWDQFLETLLKTKKQVTRLVSCDFENRKKMFMAMMKYLRSMQIWHIGLFAQNQEPIVILPWDQKGLIIQIENLFHLQPGSITDLTKFQPFEVSDIIDALWAICKRKKAEQERKKALGIIQLKKQIKKNDNQLEQQIQQQDIDEEIEQVSENKNQTGFILQTKNIDLKPIALEKNYKCYKIPGIDSPEKINQFIDYNLNLQQILISKTDIALLLSCLEPSMPKEKYREIVKHCTMLITQTTKRNIINLLNRAIKYSELEQMIKGIEKDAQNIIKKLPSYKKEDHEQIVSSTKKYLDALNISVKVVYTQAPYDTIVLCDEKIVNDGFYCKCVLKSSNPLIQFMTIRQQVYLKIQNIYKMAWKDNLSFKNQEKNKKIKELAKQLNQDIYKTIYPILSQLLTYRDYQIYNQQEVSRQIENFINKYIYSKKIQQINLDSLIFIDSFNQEITSKPIQQITCFGKELHEIVWLNNNFKLLQNEEHDILLLYRSVEQLQYFQKNVLKKNKVNENIFVQTQKQQILTLNAWQTLQKAQYQFYSCQQWVQILELDKLLQQMYSGKLAFIEQLQTKFQSCTLQLTHFIELARLLRVARYRINPIYSSMSYMEQKLKLVKQINVLSKYVTQRYNIIKKEHINEQLNKLNQSNFLLNAKKIEEKQVFRGPHSKEQIFELIKQQEYKELMAKLDQLKQPYEALYSSDSTSIILVLSEINEKIIRDLMPISKYVPFQLDHFDIKKYKFGMLKIYLRIDCEQSKQKVSQEKFKDIINSIKVRIFIDTEDNKSLKGEYSLSELQKTQFQAIQVGFPRLPIQIHILNEEQIIDQAILTNYIYFQEYTYQKVNLALLKIIDKKQYQQRLKYEYQQLRRKQQELKRIDKQKTEQQEDLVQQLQFSYVLSQGWIPPNFQTNENNFLPTNSELDSYEQQRLQFCLSDCFTIAQRQDIVNQYPQYKFTNVQQLIKKKVKKFD